MRVLDSRWLATNSNGEFVMPTIAADEYKMTQAQKNKGAGIFSFNFEMWDSARDVNVCITAKRAHDCLLYR